MSRYKLYSQLLDKESNKKKPKKQKQKIQKQQEEKQREFAKTLIPLNQLKNRFEYTCPKCDAYIVYDTLFIDDFTGRYIPLDYDTMRPHKHRKVAPLITT